MLALPVRIAKDLELTLIPFDNCSCYTFLNYSGLIFESSEIPPDPTRNHSIFIRNTRRSTVEAGGIDARRDDR